MYDKVSKIRGSSNVALVTGEERIVPPGAKYWGCTVEAMPENLSVECLIVDEIQLCADPERGHVFTDRLLNSRGKLETIFLMSDLENQIISSRFVKEIAQHKGDLKKFTTKSTIRSLKNIYA